MIFLLRQTDINGIFVPANRNQNTVRYVSVAQLVEQLTLNQWVVGSSPTRNTKLPKAVNQQFKSL